MNDHDLVATAVLLLVAVHETTVNLIYQRRPLRCSASPSTWNACAESRKSRRG